MGLPVHSLCFLYPCFRGIGCDCDAAAAAVSASAALLDPH